MAMRCSPLTFLLTGIAWLLIMALGGMALYVGTIRSTPLPATLRVLHVHGALIGGVLQLLVGAWLAHRRVLHPNKTGGQWARYAALNLGTLLMSIGFGLHQYVLVGLAGLLAIAPLLPLCGDVVAWAKQGSLGPTWAPWFSLFVVTALVVGCGLGAGYSLGLIPSEWIIHARLAHVHVLVQGFLVAIGIGLAQPLLTAALQRELVAPRLATLASAGVLLGIAILLAGFFTAQVPLQLGAGGLLLLSLLLMGFSLLRTWSAAPTRSAAADYLLLGFLFLTLGTGLGLLVSLNALSDPRPMPFGTLHLVAYTHLIFVGFILATVFGGLSAWFPILVAEARVSSHKKRGPYLEKLRAAMTRWTLAQMGTLALGTMGLSAVAALTWQHPMSSAPVQSMMWVSLAFLLASLALFAAQLAMTWGLPTQDPESAAALPPTSPRP